MPERPFTFNEVFRTIRRIIRSIDIHSKKLGSMAGVTGPQLVILKEIQLYNKITTTKLAECVCLSQSTATTILDKLVEKGMVIRTRDSTDKRQWYLELSLLGQNIAAEFPFILPEWFMEEFTNLPLWHQNQILATLQHVADMMDKQ